MESDILRRIVEELSLCRTNPSLYARGLQSKLGKFRGKDYIKPGKPVLKTSEGVSAVRECIRFLQRATPVPPLEFSEGISRACREHCEEQGPSGSTGHISKSGSTLRSRIDKQGTWSGRIAENISYRKNKPDKIVMQWLVDDGVRDRGHRDNIFKDDLRFAGAWIGPHTQFGCMCVVEFATQFTAFEEFKEIERPTIPQVRQIPQNQTKSITNTDVKTEIKNGVKTVTTTKTTKMKDGRTKVETVVEEWSVKKK